MRAALRTALVVAYAPMTGRILITISLLGAIACGSEATTAPAAANTTPGAGPQYQVVLHRPLSPGNKFRVNVEVQQKIEGDDTATSAVTSQSAAISKNFALELAGTVAIREVDSEGRATSAVLQVETFKRTDTATELLPTGSTIDAVLGQGKFNLMVNGQPRPELQQAIDLAFPLHRPGSPLGDAMFGSKTPRQVGESWTVAKSMVAESMEEQGYLVEETDLTGATQLMGTTNVNGQECLELSARLHADQGTIGEDMGMKGIGTGTINSTIKLVVPTDVSRPIALEEATATGDFALHLTEGSASTTTIVKVTRHRKALYTKTIE